MASRKGRAERRKDSPALETTKERSLPAVKVTTADQLKEKVLEIRERVEAASKPAGPLTTLFGVTTSTS
jgi:hypothetical protein